MKQYPSIPGKVVNAPHWVFAKLDGQNVRAEWNRKAKSFVMFGKRHTMLSPEEHLIGRAIEIINDKFLPELNRVYKDRQWQETVTYFEFWGPNSFAGMHDEKEEQTCTLIDIDVYKKGMIHPRDFLQVVEDSGVDAAPFLGKYNIGPEFIQSVKNGTLEGISEEGVVCKGDPLKKGYPPSMFKVKQIAWIEKLRARVSPEEFEKLV